MKENKIVYNYKDGCLNHYFFEDGSVKCQIRPREEWGPDVNPSIADDEEETVAYADEIINDILQREWGKFQGNRHHPLRTSRYIPNRDEEINAFRSLLFLFGEEIDLSKEEPPSALEYFGDGGRPWKQNPKYNPHLRV